MLPGRSALADCDLLAVIFGNERMSFRPPVRGQGICSSHSKSRSWTGPGYSRCSLPMLSYVAWVLELALPAELTPG